ncbi:hypothetical protein N7492_001154 [Penicillium capsulatum]|uniref:Calcineurin-like phosphoesterase domain-containing protein n=1 Tax=Penicillium capsulatum TaxID=69766 RepID=A0A9W9IQZ9_9EURO|nr:hypothetical protein N7492_001154 [Penicillium capsulatum]KAJ6129790.1 hypothetical protein N7512_002570 [Penicillium capsulatum]
MLRRTRFVCISDTHGYTPSDAGFKLPAGDVLIHAGDLTNNGSMTELCRTMDWISQADFETKIIVAGNHDVTLDSDFYAKHGYVFHGDRLEDPTQCLEIITGSTPSVVLLQHQAAVIRLTRPEGPNTVFKVFGSPYSQFRGNWAFGYETSDAVALWDQIPSDTDIVVTHTPPRSHCDQKPNAQSVGCVALRQALSRIRPPLAICGHVHEGRGYDRVRWRAALIGNGLDEVERVTRGVLPPKGSKKQSLVDLTGKRGECLQNRGFSHAVPGTHGTSATGPTSETSAGSSAGGGPKQGLEPFDVPALGADSHGPGPVLQTLRRETCIVNAAILATSWPHRGGKRFNTPIIVDLALPVRQVEDD